ncbi:DMT family transporter [Polycladidibacter hongkongensis]|uniref:DMT family transporter n=1 Tax=Polycladidibacter hongkongensis TaxID=1647556 RepID=UPI001AD9167A|nr:DMT family transporter [Pseudovibrio hongkongensis]
MTILSRFAPAIFVFLWSTGFIGAKLGAPYAEPFVFLLLRFACVLPLLALIVWGAKQSLTLSKQQITHALITGLLVHGVYLAGVFWAIDEGLPAGITAMVTGLQPLVTALIAGAFLGEAISKKQWIGLSLGILGLACVLAPKWQLGDAFSLLPLLAACAAMLGISFGTVWQKRMPTGTPLLAATFYQYVGATLLLLPLTLTQEFSVTFTGEFVFALFWLVFVLSIGAILLLMMLIRAGNVASTASLFYLVPIAATIESYFLFEESLSPLQIGGMFIIAAALRLARPPLAKPANS